MVADQPRRGLSLWMGQGSQPHEAMGTNLQEIHQLGSSVSSGNSLYADPLVSCSNPPPSDYQLSWVFGSKQSSNTTEDQITSTTQTPLLPSNVKEAAGSQIVSVPSLYSIQHHSHQTPSNMSATALLQKAAQMGATSADPFLGSFGLKCDSSSILIQDGNKFCGLYTTNQLPTNDIENNNPKDLSTFNQLQMYPAKRRNTQNDDTTGGQTRDFLGVGVQTICHPSSINGWI